MRVLKRQYAHYAKHVVAGYLFKRLHYFSSSCSSSDAHNKHLPVSHKQLSDGWRMDQTTRMRVFGSVTVYFLKFIYVDGQNNLMIHEADGAKSDENVDQLDLIQW